MDLTSKFPRLASGLFNQEPLVSTPESQPVLYPSGGLAWGEELLPNDFLFDRSALYGHRTEGLTVLLIQAYVHSKFLATWFSLKQ